MKANVDKELQKQVEEILGTYNALCVNAEISQRRINNINKALAVLNPEEQCIVRNFYMDVSGKNAEDLCEELNLERSSLYRKKQRALEKVAIALYGCDV